MNPLVQLSYNPTLRQVIKSSGLSSLARRLYQSARGNKPVEVSIAGVSAQFLADTIDKRREVEGFETIEGEVALSFLSQLTPDDVVYDIGASQGIYGILAAKRCRKVVCFEPFPQTYLFLQENIKLNRLTNCEARQAAVGDKKDILTMSTCTNGEIHCPRIDQKGNIKVPVLPLDALVKLLPFPTALKIDVEGFEKRVFEGALSVLPKIRLVNVELHEVHLAEEDQEWVKQLLRSHGFRLQIFTARRPNANVLAVKSGQPPG